MTTDDVPQFPRGFILGAVEAPPAFQPGPILPTLRVHPWATVTAAGDREQFVIIIGMCVSTQTCAAEDTARVLLAALEASEDRFLSELGAYAGRYAIIFGSYSAPKIVTDATGMRSVYYSEDATVAASHAVLVERALGGQLQRDRHPFQYGYPGNRTPYSRTRLLTPNTHLTLGTGAIHRFWPLTAPASRNVEDVSVEAFAAATTALRNVSVGRKVQMALTAGLDSRVILAVARSARVPVAAYTYGTEADTELDRVFARDLAASLGIPHTMVPRAPLTEEHTRRLGEAHYSAQHKRVVPGLMGYFGDTSSVALNGSLLEIGRDFFGPMRDRGVAEPVTAETMTDLHYRRTGASTRKLIDKYGEELWRAAERDAFAEYLDVTDHASTVGLVDPFDLYYWEHRMGAWLGTSFVERDFYGEAFIPFNSRNVFEAMLGVPFAERESADVFYRMIRLGDPALLDMPINPKKWPAS